MEVNKENAKKVLKYINNNTLKELKLLNKLIETRIKYLECSETLK